ncbi:uncharacterized protein LOC114431942 isoform X1 [Parambassis ranga]|uniref:Uncharacterized protein LOC114431942 isoform X1 n=1 Tax=Parambassis ranga TaxID=210632 RepID=A0A6P7HY01_9TELE|nr:uncharacterized protein LOC114431942 isoform X1 [Parambassis ranga]
MIPMGRGLCLPSPATVHQLFSVARDASIIPDISLDPVLTTFLSLDSSAALQHRYGFLQRGMSREQQAAFRQSLIGELGGSRVTYGGVGVIALALSMLFDQVAQHVRVQGSSTEGHLSTQGPQAMMIFGISTSSRIGQLINSYLRLILGIANNQETMAETTELYDSLLKLELLDHYERMINKKRMSSVSMQQWLAGAAFHLHLRLHQVRLNSVPLGSAKSLRFSYKTGLNHLIQGYAAYLRRNIQETAAPGPHHTAINAASGPKETSATNTTCSSSVLFNISLVSPSVSADIFNDSTTPNSTAGSCKTHGSTEDVGLNEDRKGNNDTTVGMINKNTLNISAGHSRKEEEHMLVIEPWRNVSHNVQHHPCESSAIQQALVTRIINAQDLERNRNFFIYREKAFQNLLRQREDFELRSN